MIVPKFKRYILFAAVSVLVLPVPAQAVIPPDFIFNIGSQVAQFFSVILLFFSAVVGTTIAFFRNKFGVIKHKKFFMLLGSGLAASLALIAVIALVVLTQQKDTYESQRLILLYTDQAGTNSAVVVQLIKYDIVPHYYHYKYTLKRVSDQPDSYFKQHEFNSWNSNFTPADLITEFSNTVNYNTLQEDLSLRFTINEDKYGITLNDLHGDFLINNALERFTYLNMGTATITINGQAQTADFVLGKTFSNDINNATLDNDSQSQGNVMFLSDQAGELYYADVTTVQRDDSGYESHAWALSKHDNVLRKSVDNDIRLKVLSDQTSRLQIPEFANAVFTLNKTTQLGDLNQTYIALLKADLIDGESEKQLIGFNLGYEQN